MVEDDPFAIALAATSGVVVADERPAHLGPARQPDEPRDKYPLCACGCGLRVTNPRWKWRYGHKPDSAKVKSQQRPEPTTPETEDEPQPVIRKVYADPQDEILDWWEMYAGGVSLGDVADRFGRDVRLVHAALLDLGVLEDRATEDERRAKNAQSKREWRARQIGSTQGTSLETAGRVRVDPEEVARLAVAPSEAEEAAMDALRRIRDTAGDFAPRRHLPFAKSLDHVLPTRGRVPQSGRQRAQDRLASGMHAAAVRTELARAGLLPRGGKAIKTIGRYWL